MTVPDWVAKYIGLEFESHGRGPTYDCWGLVRKVMADEFCIQLQDFGDRYKDSNDKQSISSVIHEEQLGSEWEKVTVPVAGDIVIFNIAGTPQHCGMVVAFGEMLHIRSGTGSCIERYDSSKWIRRVEGFYRHRSSR